MKSIKIQLIILITIISTCQIFSIDYYVDKNASGNNSGTSWQNAWRSISNINWSIIQAGDNIFISGGRDSLVYNESIIVGKSGIINKYITISKSYEFGYSGRVIIKPLSGNGILIDGKSFIIIRGFEIENQEGNLNHNVVIDNCNHVTIDSMFLRPNARGIYVQECEEEIILSRNKIVSVIYSISQTDCIYSQRNRQMIIWGNYLEIRNSDPNGHNDCFQSYQDGKDASNTNKSTVTFFNNTLFQNNTKQSNSSATMPTYGWGWFTYYNNLIIQPYSYVMGLGVQQNPDGSSNMKARIWNNTFIGGSVQDKCIYFRYMKNVDTVDVVNNIIYTSYGYGSVKIDDSPNINIKRWDRNIYYSINNNWNNQVVKLNGSWKTFSQWQSAGYDINGNNKDPMLENPEIKLNTLGDYKLNENSYAVDNGISLITIFNIDQSGKLRPQRNGWDIGAFEYTDRTGLTDTTPPEVTTIGLTNPTTLEINYSELMESLSAVNLVNYSISGGVTIISASLSTDGKRVTLTTAQHTANEVYTVTVSNVKDLAGNVILSTKNSGQYSYLGDITPPEVTTVSLNNPTTLVINYSEVMESLSAVNLVNYSISGGVTIISASLSTDGKRVTLTTTQHTANQIYTVTVSNVKDIAGNFISSLKNNGQYSYAGDSTPPHLLNAVLIDSVNLELTFSEALESGSSTNTLNYTINNGIIINNAIHSTNLDKVILRTSVHQINLLYIINVSNIKDLAGNLLSSQSGYSLQYTYLRDNSSPTLTEIQVVNSKTINVKFNEKVDPSSAKNKSNFMISNNVSITQVQLSPDSSSVVLKTSPQQSNIEYTLTVKDVRDKVGNLIIPNPRSVNYKIAERTKGSKTQTTISYATASTWDGIFSPDKTIDGLTSEDSDSRWVSAKIMPDTIEYDFTKEVAVDSFRIAFYRGSAGRLYKYSLLVSKDSKNWEKLLNEVWSEASEWTEIEVSLRKSRYVKLVLHGSNQSSKASIWEISSFGDEANLISEEQSQPDSYTLFQNYPNPFNPSTIISYTIPSNVQDQLSEVVLKVYDVLGDEIAVLVNESQAPGRYEVIFDAVNISSGIYFYRLETSTFSETKKMVLLR